ncbi:hypothetical protein KXQ82_00935 [Mucilaginibacter sp. HMF5004]|uniref:hypothetical protein n=1 Tax=Mucilaginibacter rivuli TaxID=2857527 RepID=UPI001C5FB0A0|nr:hypothetical protein [Mucilaginibacter rivuli]MBW4888253.1 hypothetical protein [Mucilaginibacter rivuli]
MPNIKFSYLYRDGGNYKAFGEVVFANPDDIPLAEVEAGIKAKLIDETYFYHKEFGVPNLLLGTFDDDFDPTWHEFESVAETCESAVFSLSLWVSVISPIVG